MKKSWLGINLIISFAIASDISIKTEGTAADGNGVSIQNSAATELLVIEGDGDVSIDGATLHIDASGNKVGIGTTNPRAQLNVYGIDGLLVQGEYGSGSVLYLYETAKMYFCPRTAAFQMGWDAPSYSSPSPGSFASGYNAGSMSWYGFGAGRDLSDHGRASATLGYGSEVFGGYSTAMGYNTRVDAENSVSMGLNTTAHFFNSLVIGRYNTYYNTDEEEGDPEALDQWRDTDPLLVCGNGSGSSSRSDALKLTKNGAVTIAGLLTQESDIHLKEDIVPLEEVLPALKNITPIDFQFKDQRIYPTGRQIGFSAQEIEQPFPELVTRDANGYLAVDYQRMAAVLLKAAQEQQAMIEDQQVQIDELLQILGIAEKPANKQGFLKRLLSKLNPRNETKPNFTANADKADGMDL